MEIKNLIQQAFTARENAYAPYSGFHVGAALLCGSGKVYMGCNVEAEGRTPACCAERVAIFKAIDAGERELVAIAIVGALKNTLPENFGFTVPCAPCRQAMAEFNEGNLQVYCAKSPEEYHTYTLDELLPFAFRITSYK